MIQSFIYSANKRFPFAPSRLQCEQSHFWRNVPSRPGAAQLMGCPTTETRLKIPKARLLAFSYGYVFTVNYSNCSPQKVPLERICKIKYVFYCRGRDFISKLR